MYKILWKSQHTYAKLLFSNLDISEIDIICYIFIQLCCVKTNADECCKREIKAHTIELKKMAHLLLHKCYIHIVFSVTETEKKEKNSTSCCWFSDVHWQYLEFWHGYKSFINQQCRLETEMESTFSGTSSSYNTPYVLDCELQSYLCS